MLEPELIGGAYRLHQGSRMHVILRCAALGIRRSVAIEDLSIRPGTWSRYVTELRSAGLVTPAPAWGLTEAGQARLAELDRAAV